MADKLTDNKSDKKQDGRFQKKRPSVVDKRAMRRSKLSTLGSSKTGTPRLDRTKIAVAEQHEADGSANEQAVRTSAPEGNSAAGKDLLNTIKAQGRQDQGGQNLVGQASASHSAGKSAVQSQRREEPVSDEQPMEGATARDKKVDQIDSNKKSVEVKAPKGLSRRFLAISMAIIFVLIVGTGLLAWNQWFRFDDAADIQGSWTIDGTEQTITFTPTDINMTAEVSYPYELDTFQKTISFSFEQYSGSGSYAFSPDRNELYITETDADSGEKVSTKLVRQ